MKRSDQRILTTHVGSLPRPDDLMALYAANAPDEKLQPRLRAAVGDIVRQQAESGIDVVNDGEFGKAMRSAMDFGAWWSYVYPRLEGFELREEHAKKGRAAWTFGSKERKEFAEFYAAEASAAASAARQSGSSSAQLYGLTCTGPVKYIGHAAIKRDIDNLSRGGPRQRRRRGVHDRGVARDAANSSQRLLQERRRTTPGRWPRRSARNTRPSSMRASSCRSTTRRWSTSTTGGSR